jgi:vitamin B12 transporter
LISTSISLLFVSFPLWAVPVPDTSGPDGPTLDTVVVSASRSAEELRNVSQSVIVITQNEIRESGAENALDILKRHGLQINSAENPNYDGMRVTMRGVSTSNHGIDMSGGVLVLIDGRRTGTDNIGILDMNSISRIEIIRGPGAIAYGSAAIGGVINVITTRGTRRANARLEAGIGSFGSKTLKGSASGMSADGKFDYALAAARYSIDDYSDAKGERNLNSAMDSRTKFATNLGWNLDAYNRIGLSAQRTETRHVGIGASTATAAQREQYKNNDYHAFDLAYEGSTQKGDKNWTLRYFTGKTTYDLHRQSALPATSGQMAPFSDYSNKFQGAQGTFHLDTGRFTLVSGIDWLDYDLDQNQPFSILRADKDVSLTNGQYRNLGLFAIGKAHLLQNRNLVLSAGVRYDTFKADMDTLYDYRQIDAPRRIRISNTYRKWLPSFGVTYSPVDHLKLRANYAYAFKMPAPREQGGAFFMSTGATAPVFVGNPNIKPEESKTFDLGLDVNYQALSAYVTYFDSDYKNMISALPAIAAGTGNCPADGPSCRFYDNLAKASLRGVEMGAAFDVGRQFGLGYSLEPYFAVTRMTKYEDDTGQKITDIAKNSASFGLRYKHPALKLSSRLDFVYYGQRAEYEKDRGGKTVADFSLTKSLADHDRYGNLKLKVSVTNLFNKYYRMANSASYALLPGRAFYVGLVYDMK